MAPGGDAERDAGDTGLEMEIWGSTASRFKAPQPLEDRERWRLRDCSWIWEEEEENQASVESNEGRSEERDWLCHKLPKYQGRSD